MPTLKQIIFASLLVLALLSTAAAQESPSATIPTSSLTITAAAAGDRVRITAPSSVVQMHVEVYAASGEKLFDQEIRGGNVFDWHLQDGQAQRLAPGNYVCVVTAKTVSGKLTQKIGTVTVAENSVVVQPAESKQLSAPQAQYIGPVEENSSWTIAAQDEPQTPTVIANDGTDGQMIRGRGALSFRIGDFFSGNDKEQMRLTEAGDLGIGTSAPQSKLDVAGAIRAERFLVVKPKLVTGQSTDGNPLTIDSNNVQPLVSGSGTTGKLTKWIDGAGGLGDSVVTELSGKIGIGTATPTQALDVLNGRIVTTGSQTLASTSDSMIEVKSAVTNSGLAQSAIKARNFFNGPGDFVTGIDAAPTFAPSASINTAQGFVAAAFFAPPPGVTITNALGGASATVYSNVTGAVTNGTAFNIVSPFVFGALKPTTQYGLHINNQGIAGTTNTYGLFVDAQTGSLNNYSAIFAGGNVGIGTTTPGFKLDVVGRMRVKQATNSATNTAGIWFNQIGPGTDQAFVGMLDDNHVGFFGSTLGGFGLTMDTTSGFVGIGTTTPSSLLDVAGNINTSTQFNIGGNRVFIAQTSVAGNNTFAGVGAGTNNTSGGANAYFGWNAGSGNTSGGSNAFFGSQAGQQTTGSTNAFFGQAAGFYNTTESGNTFIGGNAGASAGSSSATAIGVGTFALRSNSVFLGDGADTFVGYSVFSRVPDTAASDNLYIANTNGYDANSFRLDGFSDNLYIVAHSGPFSGGGAGIIFRTSMAGGGETDRMSIDANGNVVMNNNLTVNGTFSNPSDARLKRNIQDLRYGLSEVLRLKPVTWQWKNNPAGGTQLGMVAQEVEPLIPELVLHDPDPSKPLTMNYLGFLPVMIKAMQQQQAEIDTQQQQVEQQQKQIATLLTSNAALNARLRGIEKALRKRAGSTRRSRR